MGHMNWAENESIVSPATHGHTRGLEFPVKSPLLAENIPLILPFEGDEPGDGSNRLLEDDDFLINRCHRFRRPSGDESDGLLVISADLRRAGGL